MSRYILVVNRPNRQSTVHSSECVYLESHPLVGTTASSERIKYDDGLEALRAARDAMPDRYGLCSHCLKRFSFLRVGAMGG